MNINFLFFFFLKACIGCFPSGSVCEAVTCVGDTCVPISTGIDNAGCCNSNSDCAAGFEGAVELQECLTANCNRYSCANLWTCDWDIPEATPVNCNDDSDCNSLQTYCNNVYCSDTNTCDSTPILPLSEGCCRRDADCLDIPCTISQCDTEYSMCVYQEVPCSPSPQLSVALSSSSSPSISVEEQPSTVTSSSSSNSPSSSPSPSNSPSSSFIPSESPSISLNVSASVTNSHSNSSSPSIPVSQSSSESISSSHTPPVSTTSSASNTPPEKSSSPSESPSASIKESPTPSEMVEHSVNVQQTEASTINSTSSYWIWIVAGVIIIILLAISIIIGIAVFLRKRYLDTRFQPIDLIDDDEFPM